MSETSQILQHRDLTSIFYMIAIGTCIISSEISKLRGDVAISVLFVLVAGVIGIIYYVDIRKEVIRCRENRRT